MSGGVSDYRRNLAWKAGEKARLAGKPRTACDRQPCKIYADDWHDGWGHADDAEWRKSGGAE